MAFGYGGYDIPKAPVIPKMATYPGLDLTGLKDWLSQSLARQYMGAGWRPSQIGGLVGQAYSPLLQMEAQYPFQKWGAEEEARRWGAGMGTDVWKTQAGLGADIWSKMLMAALQKEQTAMQEKMWQAETGGLRTYHPGARGYWS
jgi:hypothetical protein